MNTDPSLAKILVNTILKLEEDKQFIQERVIFLNEQLKCIDEENMVLRKTLEQYINKYNENE